MGGWISDRTTAHRGHARCVSSLPEDRARRPIAIPGNWSETDRKLARTGPVVTVVAIRQGRFGGMVGTDRTAIIKAGFGLRRSQRMIGLHRL